MSAVVRRHAERQVPRYTSYPTAAEFAADVSPLDHERWLRQIGTDEPVSLYLHVPYCRDICFYCGCHAKMARRDDVVRDYRDALTQEIATVARLRAAPLAVARLHWGGGTPSILGGEGLARVVEALDRHFVLAADLDHAIELDPRYVTEDLARQLAALRVSRVSLGVQDVNSRVQAAIGREQPTVVVAAAVHRLRDVGIDAFNFDLIYGLPLQTVETLRQTCRTVTAFAPDRIACYGYAHMPQRKAGQRRIDAATLPTSAERLAQADAIAHELLAQGYVRIGFDHYARPDDPLAHAAAAGTLHRNFQGYTDDDCDTLVGFGASAISSLPGGYVQNITDVPAYLRAVGGGGLATARGCRLTTEDRVRGRIIERLLCRFSVDLDEIAPDQGFADELAQLQSLAADGLVDVDGRVITLSDEGRAVARVVATVFDTYSRDRLGRFSVAV
ncbi:oxygen-independent coproporphyrinogen III oxidase [Bradyrhizobium sp. 2TAF24]|uniref:oxygen-independent coproporphyrinogen III oxidase n=1 Tax=Bradyrhizobium sp. 2TAF24 TaxID=3233011 RepID=UPI003F8F6C76